MVDRMTFDFTANDNTSKGWMEFLYSDLDVALVKKQSDKDKNWGFVSLLANAVAVSNNPVKEKEVKIVEIGTERDKNKGLICMAPTLPEHLISRKFPSRGRINSMFMFPSLIIFAWTYKCMKLSIVSSATWFVRLYD